MVTLTPVVPFTVGVKKEVPVEELVRVRVTAEPELVTGLPNWSWVCTTKGPTEASEFTVWLPVGLDVKAKVLGPAATMLKPFVVAEVTVACVVSEAVMV